MTQRNSAEAIGKILLPKGLLSREVASAQCGEGMRYFLSLNTNAAALYQPGPKSQIPPGKVVRSTISKLKEATLKATKSYTLTL